MWLLLHHVEINEKDKSFAVTDDHAYEPTNHFRERLRNDANAPMKDTKHILPKHYNEYKIRQAIARAKMLHKSKDDKCPNYFATTVYLLLEKIIAMLPE